MLKEVSKPYKVLGAENISGYIDFELIQSGFVAKISKYSRKYFLLWVGFEPPLQVADFRAALLTASALFFCSSLSYIFASLAPNKLYISIQSFSFFLEVCVLMQNWI
jgi:hypothetical protein